MATTTESHAPADNDLADQQAQYDYERTAPAQAVSGAAMLSAAQAANGLPAEGSRWQEFTDEPFNAQPSDYTDPFWGNEGAGFSLVGGRTTALAQTPDGTWFAGTADGGVWRSRDAGKHWTAIFDAMPTLSIGALAVDPSDGSLWVGTGEANLSQDSYAGTGVYRSANDGRTWTPVGASSDGVSPLASRTIFKIDFAPGGTAYAATNNGLFRLAAGRGHWTEVLDPAGPNDFPPYDQQVTSVAVVPGSGGRQVIAAIGWHGPGNTEYNGFYQSTNGGRSFSKVTPTGDINAPDIGRTTLGYSADGKKLYAIVQSVAMITAGDESVLQGIYVSSGNPASVTGPWTKIADEAKLAASGSALAVGSGYGVGVQAWYNQDLAIDPANDNHVYAGLEEVFESTNGGSTWVTASPYWNYPFACDQTNPPTCPNTTHPDQHAMMIVDGKIVIGNDGGVYSRPLLDTQQYGDWSDLNATLDSWQYYDARAGLLGQSGVGVWGGLQDNGTSFTAGHGAQTVEPAGGDGFDVIVDPQNANNMVGEYTDGTTYSSTDGGHSFVNMSPTCVGQATAGNKPRADCDPGARFVTPWSRISRTRTCGCSAASSSGSPRPAGTPPVTPTRVPARGSTCSIPARATRSRRCPRPTTARSSTRPGSAAAATLDRPSARASPPTTAAPGIRSARPACRTATSPGSPSIRPILPMPTPSSTGSRAGGSRGVASGTCSKPWTAGRPGPTSRATCRTSHRTRLCSGTAGWPWPPTSECSRRQRAAARTRAGHGWAPACPTLRTMT
ncbi:MAG: hypothetical protein JO152_14975 [Mycobacteriaceae bacterium]|nr:hypothetical protein [Mycobacteriaceae bacterium]